MLITIQSQIECRKIIEIHFEFILKLSQNKVVMDLVCRLFGWEVVIGEKTLPEREKIEGKRSKQLKEERKGNIPNTHTIRHFSTY